MLRIKPTKKSLICLAGVAILLLCAGGFAYYSFSSKLGVLQAEITKKQTKLDHSEEITCRLASVEQQYADAQVQLGQLEKGVSNRTYVPTLLRQIEDLGKSVNMRVVGVRPKVVVNLPPPPPPPSEDGKTEQKKVAPKPPDPYDKLDIDIEVTGKYCDAARFLYKITSFPKIIAVNTVQMTPASSAAGIQVLGSPKLTIKLGTTAFILKEPVRKPEATKDEQTASAGSGQS